MCIKPLSYAQGIMENDENLHYHNILPPSVVIPYFKFIKYFCEPCLAGFSFQARERVISKIL